METPMAILVFLFLGIIVLFIFLYFVPVGLWITAVFSNVKVGLFELVGMRIRKVPPLILKRTIWQVEMYQQSLKP